MYIPYIQVLSMITDKHTHTYEDYLRLPEGAPYQLIAGELIMSPSPGFYHQKIVTKLATEFLNFVEMKNLGEVVCAPMDVKLADDEVYQPDIIFISEANRSIIHERIDGAPDLVVEILSEATAYYDLRHKKNIYEISGVKEYWIVDPMEKTIEVYHLTHKKFQLVSEVKQTGSVSSILLNGFQIELEKIF